MIFPIGKHVRVRSLDNSVSRKAMISFIHDGDHANKIILYDIIYMNTLNIIPSTGIVPANGIEEEEDDVAAERISLLQKFEYENTTNLNNTDTKQILYSI